ncbi:gamma-glutamyltransferase family protein [Celeribacter indicus]|uniref:Gamma-glutamyltranspeptidase protein n=1 Tax=Celeribacter indicus TaxID=1208324 RepID=A0A0B5E5T4_9RHOB|nr:gamma-glutamyltransferase [Celeribacter indicus]AJE48755.1 Gamma-glutamyltranspeptidase protein [Celeribacter indicus]SDX11365.1 gamma-glutamyltransferase 2. Threonine peptidase. MEROPS family T03 [Celeribacter indicus]
MIETPMSLGGMVTAPHHLAAAAGRDVLRLGGTAIEAAVATAAALSAVYPHMTGIGGDGFWLISDGTGAPPKALHATGAAGERATDAYYAERQLSAVPWRGPAAACTVPGTVAGWDAALAHSAGWQDPLPLEQILAAAIHHAETGIAVTRSQSWLTGARLDELAPVPGFADVYLPGGQPPEVGQLLRQPALAATLRRLARNGLRDFYEGETAAMLASDLAAADSPVTARDLARHRAEWLEPLALRLPRTGATVWNTRPPTQGLASLLILGIAEQLDLGEEGSFAHLHGLVEATKRAFRLRDVHVADRGTVARPDPLLEPAALSAEAAAIDPARAAPWPHPAQPGDTVWLGVTDAQGRSASFIQSLYYEFGSGLVSPQTGVLMQNRGAAFQLSGSWNRLAPGRQPFTTLNPAMALFDDGRRLTYGTMGGEGQPQTQAAVFTRIARFGLPPQKAVSAPRWLLGKTWGQGTMTLKVEDRVDAATIQALRAAGHDLEVTGPYEDFMGHAGAILRHPDGLLMGATDPRSDGAVAAL